MKSKATIIACCLALASCTVQKNVYITAASESDLAAIQGMIEKSVGKKNVTIHASMANTSCRYDDMPEVKVPRLLQPANNYNPTDMATFAVYDNAISVAEPLFEQTACRIALWRLKDKTILGQVFQMEWNRTFFQIRAGTYIRDCAKGEKYHIQSYCAGMPLNESFFIEGVAGEYIILLYEFPALPETCTTIDIHEENSKDNVVNSPGWSEGIHMDNIPVSQLQANQYILNHKTTKVIE